MADRTPGRAKTRSQVANSVRPGSLFGGVRCSETTRTRDVAGAPVEPRSLSEEQAQSALRRGRLPIGSDPTSTEGLLLASEPSPQGPGRTRGVRAFRLPILRSCQLSPRRVAHVTTTRDHGRYVSDGTVGTGSRRQAARPSRSSGNRLYGSEPTTQKTKKGRRAHCSLPAMPPQASIASTTRVDRLTGLAIPPSVTPHGSTGDTSHP